MEVKEASAKYSRATGYKQTEVGVIPEDWGIGRLGDHSEITKLAGFEYSTHFNSYKDGGEVIVIRGTNITHNSLDLSDVKTIPKSTSDKLPRSKLKEGDLVFAYVGTIGPVFLIDKDNRYHLGPNTARITCKDGLFPRFLFCYFLSDLIRKEITERISTGAQPSLSMAKIRAFRILIPTKAEQKAIAEALSDVDALIESLEQLLAKKRHLKQGTMQELLTGRTRLPGFSGEWEVKRLEEIAEIVMGQSPSSAHYNNKGDGLPLIQGNADISNRKTIKRVFTTEVTKRGRCGDILMSVRAPVGEISRAAFDVCLGRGVCAIRYPNEFLYHALIAKEPVWAKLSKGSTFDSVNSTDVKAFGIELPMDNDEQTAIATILADMDTEIAAHEEKLAKARAIKQGMMQELLTGRIRLV